jgi:predicted DNA-binding transcriptional regulator AlpA
MHTVNDMPASAGTWLAAVPEGAHPASMVDEIVASTFLGVAQRTLQAWRLRGGGPRFVKISSRCVRYRLQDLLAWQADRLRRSTSDPGPAAGAEVRP